MNNIRSQDQHESLQHGLRFEAYELPKPPVQSKVAPSSTDIVPVPEVLYSRETHHISSEAGSPELKLRLDGVRKKWGKPTHSSPTSSTSYSTNQKPTNEATQVDGAIAVNSNIRDIHDTHRLRFLQKSRNSPLHCLVVQLILRKDHLPVKRFQKLVLVLQIDIRDQRLRLYPMKYLQRKQCIHLLLFLICLTWVNQQ